jgi:hypothetical protein
MTSKRTAQITWQGLALRFAVALFLVFATYNPAGWSYFHWVRDDLAGLTAVKMFVGVLLLIGWTIFLRATLRSLGAFGLVLAFAFFGTLIWLVVDMGLVPADSVTAMTWILETVLSGVLATGVSWSHIRRRITGQVDVDEVEG